MKRFLFASAFVVGTVAAFVACKENMPDDGPTQPANSPLPKLDPPQHEPATVPGGGDGGK